MDPDQRGAMCPIPGRWSGSVYWSSSSSALLRVSQSFRSRLVGRFAVVPLAYRWRFASVSHVDVSQSFRRRFVVVSQSFRRRFAVAPSTFRSRLAGVPLAFRSRPVDVSLASDPPCTPAVRLWCVRCVRCVLESSRIAVFALRSVLESGVPEPLRLNSRKRGAQDSGLSPGRALSSLIYDSGTPRPLRGARGVGGSASG